MSIQLLTPDSLAMELLNGCPTTAPASLLTTGATNRFLKNGFIDILIQEIDEIDFGLRITTGTLYKKITATDHFKKNGLYGLFVLANGVKINVSSLGKTHLGPDAYALIYAGGWNYCYELDDVGKFQILETFFSKTLLKQMASFYPELNNILRRQENSLLESRGESIPLSLKEIYHQLQNAPLDESARQFYLELKIQEFLFQLLQNTFNHNRPVSRFTNSDVLKIYEAREILKDYIDKKAPSTKQLAHLVGINEFKLKQGFKMLFNSSIYGWIKNYRMLKAKYLVLTTDLFIKEIAGLTGFPAKNHFTNTFKKRFGFSPRDLRKLNFIRTKEF